MMKYWISIGICLLSFSTLLGQDLSEVEVETNKIISLEAEHIWHIVENWTNLPNLVPQVVKSTTVNGKGVHSTWEIDLINGGSITEKMVYYDPSRRTMSYIMTETPMPIENYLAVIKVEPYGVKKSLVSFYTTCETQKEKAENIQSNFRDFQEIYLSNLEKQNNE